MSEDFDKGQCGRKTLRLHGYDYNHGGIYFLTFCTVERANILSTVVGRDDLGTPSPGIILTDIGSSVDKFINQIPEYHPGVSVDNYVIMPNHVHLLLHLPLPPEGAPGSSRPTEKVPRIIGAIKRFTNKEAGRDLWQTSYYDHIIRDEDDYLLRWNYIHKNAFKWLEDEYFTKDDGSEHQYR